jgi:hypothetical protein
VKTSKNKDMPTRNLGSLQIDNVVEETAAKYAKVGKPT